jgi:hypothetical protein
LWHSKCHNRSQPGRCTAVTVSRWIDVTISKLKRWSINNYIDTAQAAEYAAKDLARPALPQRRSTLRCFRLDGFSDLV